MRFYARFVFICNICFIIAVIMWFIEKTNRLKGYHNDLVRLQPVEATFVILGYSAIIFNSVFFIMTLYRFMLKRPAGLPGWLVKFNLIIFPLQVYYFFFYNP